MSIKDINNNPKALELWKENERKRNEQYFRENPDSLIPGFIREIRDLGFGFEFYSQIIGFMPKYKKIIFPVAIRYYQMAKKQYKYNEQDFFMSFLGYKGCDEVIPELLADYYSEETPDLTRWFISDCLFRIRSKRYFDEYLDIIKNSAFGGNRQLIILLVGKMKEEKAVPILIDLLEDEEVRLHAICALGDYKREEFRCYFERFQNSKHPGWRKYAKVALKKLEKAKS